MSRARNLANLGNKNTLTGISTSGRVGIGSTIPDTKLDVDGTITATSFSGDGSGLSGLGTANVSTSDLFVVGVSTLSDTVSLPDDKSITLGADDDLEIHHAGGGNSYIKNNTGELEIRSDTTKIVNKNNSQTIAGFTLGASVGITTVGILTAYDSITVKVGSGSTELTSAIKTNTTNIATKASTGKAIAMAMVFG